MVLIILLLLICSPILYGMNRLNVEQGVIRALFQGKLYKRSQKHVKGCKTFSTFDCGAVSAEIMQKIEEETIILCATQLGALYFYSNSTCHPIVQPASLELLEKKFYEEYLLPHKAMDYIEPYDLDAWLDEYFPHAYTALALNKTRTHAAAAKDLLIEIYDLERLVQTKEARPLQRIDLPTAYTHVSLLALSPSAKRCALVAKDGQKSADLVIAPVALKSKDYTIVKGMLSADFTHDACLQWNSDLIISVQKTLDGKTKRKKIDIASPLFDLTGHAYSASTVEKTLPGLLQVAQARQHGFPSVRSTDPIRTELYSMVYSLDKIELPIGNLRKALSSPMQTIISHIITATPTSEKQINKQPHGLLYAYTAACLFGGSTEMCNDYRNTLLNAHEQKIGTVPLPDKLSLLTRDSNIISDYTLRRFAVETDSAKRGTIAQELNQSLYKEHNKWQFQKIKLPGMPVFYQVNPLKKASLLSTSKKGPWIRPSKKLLKTLTTQK